MKKTKQNKKKKTTKNTPPRQTNLLHLLYIYSTVCKQMTDVKLILLHTNT